MTYSMGRFAAYDWAKGVVHTGKSIAHIDTERTIPHYPLSLIKSLVILNEKENENEDAEDEAETMETVWERRANNQTRHLFQDTKWLLLEVWLVG